MNTDLDWDFHVYYYIIHSSRVEEYSFSFWCQSRMLLQRSFSKSVALHVTICLLWQGGGISGCVWCRSCLSSVAELILKTEGAIHHPLSLWYKTSSPSVLKFLNKLSSPHTALILGRNWIPCKHLLSRSFLLLHICPLNSFLLCFLMKMCLQPSANMLKTPPVTLTCVSLLFP